VTNNTLFLKIHLQVPFPPQDRTIDR